ncbi:MAG: NYN domain-containing protein [Deltaproteobacteria bacterium]|nr:NYN domain-containing protein [Deltaproteobacteria bacterium]
MPFHIVVDGYNVIGSEQGLRGDLEHKRNALVNEVAAYHARTGHSLTTVFDGWRNGRDDETRQQVGDVTVVFSRYGEKADAVIERLAREIGDTCIVVTSDRDLRRSVESSGAVAVYVGEFLAKMRVHPDMPDPEDGADDLEPLPRGRDGRKKGNPRRLSKAERVRRERLAKL